MYMLNDGYNLKKQDKALKLNTDKFRMFEHKMLTRQERKDTKAQARDIYGSTEIYSARRKSSSQKREKES